MKKFILIILSVSILGITVLSAHPASLVTATFDREKSNLIVSFAHKVNSPQSHFIDQIKVQLNKKEIINQNIFKQETDNGGTVYYKIIDAKVGDKITVITNCNKTGKKSTTIEVK